MLDLIDLLVLILRGSLWGGRDRLSEMSNGQRMPNDVGSEWEMSEKCEEVRWMVVVCKVMVVSVGLSLYCAL